MSKEKAETESAGNTTYKPNVGPESCADCERPLMAGEGFERMEGSEDGPVRAVRCRDCAEEHGLPANAKPTLNGTETENAEPPEWLREARGQ